MRRNVRRVMVGITAVAALAGTATACGDDGESAEPRVIPYQAGQDTTPSEPVDPTEAPEEPAQPQADDAAVAAAEERGAPELPEAELVEVTELKVEDLAEGEGAEVTADSTVIAHYTGWSVKNEGAQFDSSWDRGEPATFPLSGVIAGWTEGLQGMKVGGRRLLVIPPDKGYGDQARGEDIAANDTLIFVVDIVGLA